MALSGESWVADVTEFPFKRPFLSPIRYGCVFPASKCLQAEYSKQAKGDSLIFWKERDSEDWFCRFWLSPRCWGTLPTSWTWSVPAAISPALPHTFNWNAAGERIFTFTKGRVDFFFFSKITVVGGLTLQVLLIWTVSSLGGFPSNCPHHPSLHQTHTSKH